MQGELKLANGQRTGRLGGKRKAAIDDHQFSEKNFCQLYRLAWAGAIYFKKGYFPVNVKEEDESLWEFLMKLKTRPREFNVDYLNKLAAEYERQLVLAFENRESDRVFDEDLANELCYYAYAPMLR